MSKWLLGLTIAGLFAVGCAQAPSGVQSMPGAGTLAYDLTDVAKGADSRITETRRVVVKDEAAWQALWREHAGSDKARPTVDFSKDMVLAAFAGERLTAGYVVTVQSTQTRGSQLLVNVREAGPGPGEVAAQVLTTPFHIVRTAKREAEVVFIEAPGVPTR